MKIVQNITALFAHRKFSIIQQNLTKTAQKLSSGYRINYASDDASGLAISEGLRAQRRGLLQGTHNITDGVSLVQTAESTLGQIQDMLQRIRTLAVQASNSALTASDRIHIQKEVDQIIEEIDRLATSVNFNTIKLLTGDFSNIANSSPTYKGGLIIQSGANQKDTLKIYIRTISAKALGIDVLSSKDPNTNYDLLTRLHAEEAIGILQNAIEKISGERTSLGAYQNQLQRILEATQINKENVTGSESRIRDADFAYEMVEFAKNQILTQSSTSMLAQANLRPRAILSLLG
jgi:flagellin